MRVAVFDLEIKKPISECTLGWSSYGEMGVSVLVIYDYVTHRYRVFDDKNIKEGLDILCNYDVIAGYNTVSFDWKVINATYDNPVRTSKDYDILREIWISLGLNPEEYSYNTHSGYKLNDVVFDTIGMHKSGNGSLAPVLYQEGRYAELVDYCLHDVKITKELFDFARRYRYVVRENQRIVMPGVSLLLTKQGGVLK
jgi:hypothetical protein